MPRLLGILLILALPLFAQKGSGELDLQVVDSTGALLESKVELVGHSTGVRLEITTGTDGQCSLRPLPFGFYRLTVQRQGFDARSELIEIRSEVPLRKKVILGVAAVETTLVVQETDTLLDPHRTATVFFAGAERLAEHRSAQAARGVLEMVNSQPGWLLEANGVLHPRGSEYSTQYVIDGVPITDNRSPGFAPALEVSDLGSMNVLTAGYPAEYGRKLGGVVEVVSRRDADSGFHGQASMEGGSFRSQSGHMTMQQRWRQTTLLVSGNGGSTRRFLDPPAVENFTNKASGSGVSTRLEHDLTPKDRLSFYLHSKQAGFLVPNEPEQQEEGQRQDRRNGETLGQFSYQRVISPALLGNVRGMVRDLSAQLWSNPLADPIDAAGERGFREGYLGASLAWTKGRHSLKTGGEFIATNLHESFRYRITRAGFFDDDFAERFAFADDGKSRETALYIQDLIRAGRFTFSAGLRWDRYALGIRENAFSPRLGIGYHIPRAGLRLHASYDRAFESPPVEGILVANSPLGRLVSEESEGLPVRPSRGNFYQIGFAKSLWGRMRLDGNYYKRLSRNFSDDGLLLNTGVSFPITFDRADIHGVEAKLELPQWGRFSGFLSYSNMTGTGWLPLTGGLFLEEDTAELLRSSASFPITQDQRNTVRARGRVQLSSRLWVAAGGSYNSGLPFEREGDFDEDEFEERFNSRILDRVNFERGRVMPQFSLDASIGLDLVGGEQGRVRLQADTWNLTNRLNVINFSGLFSGTAIGVPRSGSLRLLWLF